MALCQNAVPFTCRTLHDRSARAALNAHWPFARVPLRVDDGRSVVESTHRIEHLLLPHAGLERWLPDDPVAALELRFLDQLFDNAGMAAVPKPVFAVLKPDGAGKDEALAAARRARGLDHGWLEQRLAGRTRAAGESVRLADCAAAPSLRDGAGVHGCSPSQRPFQCCGPTGHGCWRGPQLPAPSTTARPYRPDVPLRTPDRDEGPAAPPHSARICSLRKRMVPAADCSAIGPLRQRASRASTVCWPLNTTTSRSPLAVMWKVFQRLAACG